MGDALAMTVMREKDFQPHRFRPAAPGGSLGARLKPVRRLMHGGDQLPLVSQDTSMHDTVVEMSAKRLGVVGVTNDKGHLIGSSPTATCGGTSSRASIIRPRPS
jgi:arabinose-5-phosphate isomerase